MFITANCHKYVILSIIFTLNTCYANISGLATDEVKEISSKSETIEESNETNKLHGEKIHDRRNGHRKIHIITVKKLKNVKDRADACDLQHKRGPCNEIHDRYYYDLDAHECKHFQWGGCEPNQNNFRTRPECESACMKKGTRNELIHMHTNNGYPPRQVENEIVKCDDQKLRHCENTKADWGPDIGRECNLPENKQNFDYYEHKNWLNCASRYAKECTDCLCNIHSMKSIFGFNVPCCHGECTRATGWKRTGSHHGLWKSSTTAIKWATRTTKNNDWKSSSRITNPEWTRETMTKRWDSTTKPSWAPQTTRSWSSERNNERWEKYRSSDEYILDSVESRRRNHNKHSSKGWNKRPTTKPTWKPATITRTWEPRTTKPRWELKPITTGWKSSNSYKELGWKTTIQEPRWTDTTTTVGWKPTWETTHVWRQHTTRSTLFWKSSTLTPTFPTWHQQPTTRGTWNQPNDYIEDYNLSAFLTSKKEDSESMMTMEEDDSSDSSTSGE